MLWQLRGDKDDRAVALVDIRGNAKPVLAMLLPWQSREGDVLIEDDGVWQRTWQVKADARLARAARAGDLEERQTEQRMAVAAFCADGCAVICNDNLIVPLAAALADPEHGENRMSTVANRRPTLSRV
ncbi:MAG: hypothetical protein ACJ74V_02285 [Gaiellaceae bacterium]